MCEVCQEGKTQERQCKAENERLLRSLAASRALVQEKDKALTIGSDYLFRVSNRARPPAGTFEVSITVEAALALTEEAMLKRLEHK